MRNSSILRFLCAIVFVCNVRAKNDYGIINLIVKTAEINYFCLQFLLKHFLFCEGL